MRFHAASDTTSAAGTPDASTAEPQELELSATATLPVADVLSRLGSSDAGLSSAEASRRLAMYGPNVLAAHGVSAWSVLARQLRSYLLLLLLVAAVVSAVVGDLTEALIIGAIMAMSIGLSFFNEYRSEKAVEELHSQIKHLAAVDRDGAPAEIAVTQLVPGDVVHLRVGDVIPADLRLLEVHELECDESVLTGESQATEKTADAQPPGDSPLIFARARSWARSSAAATGAASSFARARAPRSARSRCAWASGRDMTAFQQGLQDFSRLLATVTAVLAGSIFVINAALGRSLLQSALFALAIAVGLTPQLLPAIVTVSLSTGARRLAKKRVIVKRLVAIEDLGNVQVLFTDKTGTLTEGQISFTQALDGTGKPDEHVRALGLACSDKTGNELDRALWAAPQAAHSDTVSTPTRPPALRPRATARLGPRRHIAGPAADLQGSARKPSSPAARPSPPRRRRPSTASSPRARESSRSRAARSPPTTSARRRARPLPRGLPLLHRPGQARRQGLARPARPSRDHRQDRHRRQRPGRCTPLPRGRPRPRNGRHRTGAREARRRRARRAAAGDDRSSPASPRSRSRGSSSPSAASAPTSPSSATASTTRSRSTTPTSASRSTRPPTSPRTPPTSSCSTRTSASSPTVSSRAGASSPTRSSTSSWARSSNFGNMFSAAGASLFLPFLPMLPTQILLNNLLYDVSEMTIPTDNVDEELLARPAKWDIRMIRRFMSFFGPISSVYDFLTFAVMLRVFDAGPVLFRSGWFVESLTTQTLVIFVIRTRRVPFYKSRPSRPLLTATLACAAFGVALPYIPPLAHLFGFKPLPLTFLAILALMIATYLALAQIGVALFFKPQGGRPLARAIHAAERRITRRASRWGSWRHATKPTKPASTDR